MSAVIAVLSTPYFAISRKMDGFTLPMCPPGEYTLHVMHERATPATLDALTRRVTVHEPAVALPLLSISESGYLPHAAQEQIRERLSAGNGRFVLSGSEEVKGSWFSRLSLLPKALLVTSLAITVLFGVTGWLVQRYAVHTTSQGLEEEVRASLRAYESLWRSRADMLASVSLVISNMSDVRAAFSTRDQATIRDTAGELWAKISHDDAIFLVTDPQGTLVASLSGESRIPELSIVRAAADSFPAAGDRLHERCRAALPSRHHPGICTIATRSGAAERPRRGIPGDHVARAVN